MTETITSRTVRSPAAPPVLGGLGLFTVLLGAALPLIDFFIVNVALPTIGHDLAAGEAVLELVVAGYGVAYAVLLVLGGRLGDMFGRRRLFLGGMVAFGLTSLACGLAPSAWTLVAARVAQGAASAAMLPQVLATIQSATAGPRRARAMGLYGATAGLSMVAGQILGGVLVAADIAGTGWRSVFLVNVPVVLRRPVPGRPCGPRDPLPAPGAGGRPRHGPARPSPCSRCWPRSPRAGRRAGRCGRGCRWRRSRSWRRRSTRWSAGRTGWAVRRWSRRACSQLISLRRGLVMILPFSIGFSGFMFVIAVALQQGRGPRPGRAGLALVPMAVVFFVRLAAGPRLVARYGTRVVTAGAAGPGRWAWP